MKKQSAAGLFFSILLKAIVILLGVAIVVFGIFFIIKVLKTDNPASNPTTTVSDNVLTEAGAHDDLLYETTVASTEATTEFEQTSVTPYNSNILVLNSTETTGLAGRWCEKFNGYGYSNTMASDYSIPQETTRIVAKREDLGQDFIQYFNGASYEVGEVTEGVSIDTDDYDVVIIIGTADDDSQ
ncbi:MAG: LytR C-terminal domain-containing protein [Lachnospiraceae bacterium]|nr:LytR C-terminal domain-containing protein [Lachnospiraceae bacterium]MBQ9610110.1 LytR C-terminal domain-containing protein [Lachnospiraceae bacterium]